MTFRFKVNEPIAKGASRIAIEQIDIARARLASRNDIPSAIHDARRCLKRLRALLRLIRPALAESTYKREANRLAAVGKLLADARDRYVMQQTLAKLASRFSILPKNIGVQLNKLMANGASLESAGDSSDGRRKSLQALEQARTFFTRLERRDLALRHLMTGLERSYRRSRRAFRQAYQNPSDEAFHDWRKTVQQHWRHMQLLSRGWPDVMSGRAGEAKEVSRLIGEDHDLHVLLAFAAERGKAVVTSEELAGLMAMGRSLQAELRELARPRGARLFAEKATDLTERIELYWLAARDLSVVSQSHEEARVKAKRSKPADGSRRRRAGRARQAASRGSPGPGSSRPGR